MISSGRGEWLRDGRQVGGGRLEAAEECQLEKIKSEEKGFGEREQQRGEESLVW